MNWWEIVHLVGKLVVTLAAIYACLSTSVFPSWPGNVQAWLSKHFGKASRVMRLLIGGVIVAIAVAWFIADERENRNKDKAMSPIYQRQVTLKHDALAYTEQLLNAVSEWSTADVDFISNLPSDTHDAAYRWRERFATDGITSKKLDGYMRQIRVSPVTTNIYYDIAAELKSMANRLPSEK